MTVKVGDKLPDATLLVIGQSGPEKVDLRAKLKGRKVALFAVPGAFTPTCHSAHVPSFIRTREAFAAKGVAEVICLSVNDPYVMKFWGEVTGADKAGLTLLSDADCKFTDAIGMRFDSPGSGLLARSKRYAMLVDDGVVTVFHPETKAGQCEISGGEALLHDV